ncbi:mechanosensitive ion channel family protein [Chryseolinea lacunae]|uniref:Mechanosensitive ion channel n=1 Tax=Chryseolinea lacunae TaxID=2801331 RepID=A0ABS1KMH7_9BACT|nr:mechanosensitive ion channel domain-containing protein [Chryseolinea lacunae]MBL0740447.1 mechanosensitive ion channel [Chryseolinea lacunae]
MTALIRYGKQTFFISLLMLATATIAFSQQQPKDRSDSGRTYRRDRGNAMTLFADSASATSAEFMLHLESAYQRMDSIQGETKLSPEIMITGLKLRESDTVIQFVNKSLSTYDQTLNLRNLEMLKILLENVQRDLRHYNEDFKERYTDLEALRTQMRSFRRDTVLRQLFRDSVARKKFLPQLQSLRAKRRVTDSLLRTSLTTVNAFKTQASAGSILSAQLMSRLDNQLSMASKTVFSKEVNYLWEHAPAVAKEKQNLREILLGDQTALNLYFTTSAENRFVRYLIGIAFLWWVVRNLRILKREGKVDTLKPYDITYVTHQPIASTFAVIFTIAPLFDLHAPAAYVQSVQLLLLIALTFLYRKQWPRTLFTYWLGVVVLFLLFSVTSHIIVPSVWQRLFIIAMNVAGAGLAWLFLKALPANIQLRRFLKIVLILQIGLHVLAIIFNIYGRITLSQMLGATSVFAVTQVIGLSALVEILIEALLLQIHTSRVKNALENAFDHAPIVHNFRKPLLWIVVVMWLIVFTTNLNLYDTLFNNLSSLLNETHNIGSTTFTFGSILLFFLIIWLAHFLQRYVGYVLGDIGDDDGEGLAHRSKLLMTRLIVLSAGYLLAVSASGLPVDRITIVLGALGVGIGLGLQNIVNNFVSGIILIFDRPLKVGDSVEVGSHAGRVKEIGLRSSTLATTDGADIIIPNGDVLSQHIVNWTHGNTFKRIDLVLTVLTSDDKETVIALIKEVIRSTDRILKKRDPVVLVDSVKDGEMTLRIYFWCEDVLKADITKSDVRYQLHQEFKVKGIGTK